MLKQTGLNNSFLKRIFLVALISMLLLIAACGKTSTPNDGKTAGSEFLVKPAPATPQPAASGDSVAQISGAVTDASNTDKELNIDDADKAVSGTNDALKDW